MHEEFAQIAVAAFTNAQQALFATRRMLTRHRPFLKALAWLTAATNAVAVLDRKIAGIREPFAQSCGLTA
jgi:hypothetical protein